VIVLDASAVVELLLGTSVGRAVAARIASPALSLHVPHLLDVEVTQALRRCAATRVIDDGDATRALALRDLDLERHSHEALLDRAWTLRRNVSVRRRTWRWPRRLARCCSPATLARWRPGIGASVELVTHA
jgi:predicted nucleic acid-binding protein